MSDVTERSAEDRQNAFDDRLEAIRREGILAWKAGMTRADNPYAGHAETHFENAWIGGMAEAQLDDLAESHPAGPVR